MTTRPSIAAVAGSAAILAVALAVCPVALGATQPVSDWRALYATSRALQDKLAEPLLLAPVGDPARAVARRAASLFSAGEIVVRALPTIGDRSAEIALALHSTHTACALVLVQSSDGLSSEAVGRCSPDRQADQTGAPGSSPPHLAVGTRRGDPSWLVRVDGGQPIDAWRFATLMADIDLRDELITERRRHRVGRSVLASLGAGLLASAIVPLASSFGASGSQHEDRLLSSFYLASSGGVVLLARRLDRRGLDARQQDVGRYLHPLDAAAAVADYNRRLDRSDRPSQLSPPPLSPADAQAPQPGAPPDVP